MREMPIVFAAEEVRATLAGRKTQYRRPLSARNCLVDGVSMSAKRWDAMQWDWGSAWVDDGPSPAGNPGPYLHVISLVHWTTHRIYPRVRPGDRLWVREAWRASSAHNSLAPRDIPVGDGIEYAADPERILTGKTRTAIHMPRWASRITLEVTGVRVGRLQDISEADALAEGIGLNPSAVGVPMTTPFGETMCRTVFRSLWESIHGPGSWDANPWLGAVEFARMPG